METTNAEYLKAQHRWFDIAKEAFEAAYNMDPDRPGDANKLFAEWLKEEHNG